MSAPLRLVRRPAPPPGAAAPAVYRTILGAVDGSPFAEEALDQAFALARVTGATLVLVGAVAPVFTGTDPLPPALHQAATDDMQTYLARTALRLENLGLTVDTQLMHGPPAEAILATADRSGADLILLATHGRSGWQQVRFGSVALKVVQAAQQPVWLVRAGATPAPRLGSGPSVAAPGGAGTA
ncbi:MAG: universal stress protein, partial [Actinomycetota bacterium]|nr:universal stress protein [Actinomycetota bacterium]